MRERKSADDRKAEITHTALSLAFELGPDRVTTGLIAERLGLTQPAIYKHFPSKRDIWRAATVTLCDKIADNISAAANEIRPDIRLRKLVMGHLRLLQDNPALPEIMVMRDPGGEQAELRTQIPASMAAFRQALVAALADARAARLYRQDIDVRDCANLLIGVIQGQVLRLLRNRGPGDLVTGGERLLDLQLSLFAEAGDRRCGTP